MAGRPRGLGPHSGMMGPWPGSPQVGTRRHCKSPGVTEHCEGPWERTLSGDEEQVWEVDDVVRTQAVCREPQESVAVRAGCGPVSGKEAGAGLATLGGISKSRLYPKRWAGEAPGEEEVDCASVMRGQIWNPGKWGLGQGCCRRGERQLAPLEKAGQLLCL